MHPRIQVFLAWLSSWPLNKDARQRRNDYRNGKQQCVGAPESRLKSRRRALTTSLSSYGRRHLSSQSQSFLISRLPHEVRQLIWKECLGGMTFHLDRRYNCKTRHTQLSYIMCRSPGEPESCEAACWPYWRSHDSPFEGNKAYENGMAPPQLLSILLSCRQVSVLLTFVAFLY
jgi:hypothetical protein